VTVHEFSSLATCYASPTPGFGQEQTRGYRDIILIGMVSMKQKIKIILRYFFALLPAIVTLGSWKLAVWAYGFFACQGGLKNLAPCFAGGVNILPALGIGLFWCQLLTWICVPISGWLLIRIVAERFAQR
jgi:hypothetical protein